MWPWWDDEDEDDELEDDELELEDEDDELEDDGFAYEELDVIGLDRLPSDRRIVPRSP